VIPRCERSIKLVTCRFEGAFKMNGNGSERMSKPLMRFRRPLVRVADGLRYDRDRRRHIRQFRRVTRVTLRDH
jgi:hypothetical protein